MKRRAWLLALLCSPVVNAGVVVVVPEQTAVAELSRSEVRDLYLGLRKATDSGIGVRPYASSDESLQRQFGEQVLAMTAVAYKAHWARMVFAGNGRPPRPLVLADVGDVSSLQPPPLLYVDERAVPEGWRVVFRLTAKEE